MDQLIRIVEEHFKTQRKEPLPEFHPGDTITVYYRIKEGNKERVQAFRGVVLQIRGKGLTKTFTVRKISNGVGVERIFPINSPYIEKIEVNKRGKVRRARLFYLRKLSGKKARIKEKREYGSQEKQKASTETTTTTTTAEN